MSDTYDYGPLQSFEITWKSGHVETVKAHQVTWPTDGLGGLIGNIALTTKTNTDPMVHFHGEIDGKWRLVLMCREGDLQCVRNVTDAERLDPDGAR